MTNIELMNLESENLVAERVEQLKQLFPEIATEGDGSVDFEKLRLIMGDEVNESDERYSFIWPGKRNAIRLSQTPSYAALRPQIEKSRDRSGRDNSFDSNNLYIEGDNLEVLKLLQHSYHGKIKMIYIDPPYNTGKDFVYKDSFEDSISNYKNQVGLSGQSNADATGRAHSKWCSMMYSRLKLARELLTDDGVIFISIDDNELTNLIKIGDEIFGENNRPEVFHHQVRYANKSLNERDDFQKLIEYTVVYCRNRDKFVPKKDTTEYDTTKFNLEIKEMGTPDKRFSIGDRDIDVFLPGNYSISQVSDDDTADLCFFKETWITGSIYSGTGHGTTYQRIVEPRLAEDGLGVLYKIHGLGEDGLGFRYMTGPRQASSKYGKMYSKIPVAKLDGIKAGTYRKEKPIVNFYDYSGDYGNIRHEGGIAFNGGKKPVKMLMNLLKIVNLKSGDIVLDFFSGSASTAEATIKWAKENNHIQPFIMVQMPEPCSEKTEAFKGGFRTISDIGMARIRNVGDTLLCDNKKNEQQLKIDAEPCNLPDIGFRVFKLDESGINKQDLNAAAERGELFGGDSLLDSVVKPNRTNMDIVFEMMLKWGLELTLPVEKTELAGYECYVVAGGELVCCMAPGLTVKALEDVAELEPRRVLILDSILTDTLKLNAVQIFKRAADRTGVEVELRTI